jgi:hypothetical protein
MHRQHRHADAPAGVGIGGKSGHCGGLGAITGHALVQCRIVLGTPIPHADVAERIATAEALEHDVLEALGGPVQMADERSLGDTDHVEQGLQVAALLLAALRARTADPGAGFDTRLELGAAHLAIRRQSLPHRVRRLVGSRMIAADRLVDDAQVKSEIVRTRAAAEHAAGEQDRVVGRPAREIARRVGLGTDRGDRRAP